VAKIIIQPRNTNAPRTMTFSCDPMPGSAAGYDFLQGSTNGVFTNVLTVTTNTARFTNLPHAGPMLFAARAFNRYGMDGPTCPAIRVSRLATEHTYTATGQCWTAKDLDGYHTTNDGYSLVVTGGLAPGTAFYLSGMVNERSKTIGIP
jgi:hypothetical protein